MIIRSALLALAFIFAPFSALAINKAGMSGFRYSVSDSGKIATIRPNQAGSTGTLGSVGSVPAGQVGSQIGNTGWYVGASGSGNPSGRGTMVMGHAGDVFFAGTKYPFQAGYQVPKYAVVEALGMLCKNPLLCLGIAAASPAISNWLAEGKVGINPNDADYPEKPFMLKKDSSSDQYQVNEAGWFSTPSGACSARLAQLDALFGQGGRFSIVSVDSSVCMVKDSVSGQVTGLGVSKRTGVSSSPYPASMRDIEPYMDEPDVPAEVVRDLLDRGADITLPSTPTVTGPSQVQGPKQETSNPDGTKTTSQVTNNYRTDGNTITNTTSVTINQKCTASGSCTDTSVTTTNHPDEPKKPEDPASDTPLPPLPKLYERKYPDGMVGIWNKKKDQFKQTGLVTFVNQMMPTGFVSGSCPSWQIDLSLAQWADMGVYEVAPPCWLWPVAKTILIVSALLLARSLIFGG